MEKKSEAGRLIRSKLVAFCKTGVVTNVDNTIEEILDIISPLMASVDQSYNVYRSWAHGFLQDIILHKGLPLKSISSASSDLDHAPKQFSPQEVALFEIMLPRIMDSYEQCLRAYRRDSANYREKQINDLSISLRAYLNTIPKGGTKDKSIVSKITYLKNEALATIEWNRVFDILAHSRFPSAISHIVAEHGGAIAVIWCSHWRDASYNARPEHKARDGKVYAIRGNWAIEKKLMKAEIPNGYYDEITGFGEEIGCCCYGVYLYAIRRLPDNMLTTEGLRRKVERLVEETRDLKPIEKQPTIIEKTDQKREKQTFLSYFRGR